MVGIYDMNSDVKVASETPSYIKPGIHEDVRLVEVKYSTTVNNNEFLAFLFENKHGDKLSLTEWPQKTKGNKSFDSLSNEDKKAFIDIVGAQKSRIKQILKVFLGDSYKDYTAGSFKEWALKTIEMLGSSYKEVPLRIKAIYDSKGFTTLANKHWYTFIEPMTIAKEDSKIEILPGYDKMTRESSTKDVEINESNPLEETPVVQGSPKNDSPF